MLIYKCRYCGATKDPDGKGCQCGASWASLEVIKKEESVFSDNPDSYLRILEDQKKGWADYE